MNRYQEMFSIYGLTESSIEAAFLMAREEVREAVERETEFQFTLMRLRDYERIFNETGMVVFSMDDIDYNAKISLECSAGKPELITDFTVTTGKPTSGTYYRFVVNRRADSN